MEQGQSDELVQELAAIRQALEEQNKLLEVLVAEVANLR